MTLHERLETIFQQVLGEDELALTDETAAADLPRWDSLAHINAMFSIEEEFGVQFLGEEFIRLQSVGELKESLRRKGVPD